MTTIKEELFHLIRSEKVILWAGAGLSMYAGYPNGRKLSEIIVKTLPANKQSLISTEQPLDVICEQFIRITGNNRTALWKVLDRVFSQKPKSIDIHKKLSLVPHFKTVVTTNYDSLFELGFDGNIQVIATSGQLPDMENKKPHLFKIHGDLNHKENIIISKSDYANYFNVTNGNVYWTTVTERIINNNILFIGYALGDVNIEAIIQSVSSQLQGKQRRHFLVTPGLKSYDIENLQMKNILYIDSTAEKFVEELIAVLRDNIIKDYRSGVIGMDTLNAFLQSHDLAADFIASRDTHIVGRISSRGGTRLAGVLSISGEPNVTRAIADIGVGKSFEPLKLDVSQITITSNLAGIKLFSDSDLESMVLTPRPKMQTQFDIDFDNGFGLEAIPVKLFLSEYKSSTVVEFQRKIVKIDMDKGVSADFQFQLEYPAPYGKPREELNAFTFLLHLAEGIPFTVFLNGKGHRAQLPGDEAMANVLRKYVSYFEALIKIERSYKLRFDEVDEISESKFNIICVLLEIINTETIPFDASGNLEIVMSEFDTTQFHKPNCAPDELSIVYTDFTISLYGRTFRFKERVWQIYSPELIKTEELPNGNIRITLRSKVGKGTDKYVLYEKPWQFSDMNY